MSDEKNYIEGLPMFKILLTRYSTFNIMEHMRKKKMLKGCKILNTILKGDTVNIFQIEQLSAPPVFLRVKQIKG